MLQPTFPFPRYMSVFSLSGELCLSSAAKSYTYKRGRRVFELGGDWDDARRRLLSGAAEENMLKSHLYRVPLWGTRTPWIYARSHIGAVRAERPAFKAMGTTW